MPKIKMSNNLEHKDSKLFLKEILDEIPKKNKVINKQETFITYEDDDELEMIVSIFSAILTERKLIDYLYGFCQFTKIDEKTIPKFIETFLMVNSSFVSYALIITKIELIAYINFNSELDIEAFSTFNMYHLNTDMDKLVTNPDIIDNVFHIMNTNMDGMVDIFNELLEIEEENQDKEQAIIKDIKVYFDKGIKCITDKNIFIDRQYIINNFNVDIDKKSDDIEKLFMLIRLVNPSRVILYSSIPDDIKETLIETVRTFSPIMGQIAFFNAEEPKPLK